MIRLATIALILGLGPAAVLASDCPYRQPDMGAHTCPAGSSYDAAYKQCVVS